MHDTKKRNPLRMALIVLSAFILLFCIISMIATRKLYDGNFQRAEQSEFSGYLKYDDIEGYDRTIVDFKSGENKLTGYLYGEENDKGLVVIAHGLGGGAEDYLCETMNIVDSGWRVFCYDCTGSYKSEGKGTVGLAQSAIDLRAALDYIEQNSALRDLPVMLYGHSWGGYAVTAVLNYDYDISAVVSVSGYNSPMGLLLEQARGMMGFLADIEYPFLWAYQTMLFGKDARVTAVDGINKSGVPVMIVHGTGDEAILYDGSSIIARHGSITNPNVVYRTYSDEHRDGHNNLFVSKEAAEYIRDMNEIFETLYESHGGNIPHEEFAGYYTNIDKSKTSELDPGYIHDVNSFFEASLDSPEE